MWALCAVLCVSALAGVHGNELVDLCISGSTGVLIPTCDVNPDPDAPEGVLYARNNFPGSTCYNQFAIPVINDDPNATAYIRCYSPTARSGMSPSSMCEGTLGEATAVCDDLVVNSTGEDFSSNVPAGVIIDDFRLPASVGEAGDVCGSGCGADGNFMWLIASSDAPTLSPTDAPTLSPTDAPTDSPTPNTGTPTTSPTTGSPTPSPTETPTTAAPTTMTPTLSPTPFQPTPSGNDVVFGVDFPAHSAAELEAAAGFRGAFKAAVVAKLAMLESPVTMEQVNIHSIAAATATSPATGRVTASVYSLGAAQGAGYFAAFVQSFGAANASALPDLVEAYGADSATGTLLRGHHMEVSLRLWDHALSTFENATFRAQFEADLRAAVSAPAAAGVPEDRIDVWAMQEAPQHGTNVTFHVMFMQSLEVAREKEFLLGKDVQLVLPALAQKYGRITAQTMTLFEGPLPSPPSPPPIESAAATQECFTSVLFSLVAAGVLAQLSRN
eukprot:CAMPEP_0118956632 /NCGR_PEP_ID=MMETSP1169-20130426/61679_1 /TAXON_ID=36882 /ORGANISM="Pyramimonas obovata, Strain CCMP722" /LENGTH=498 /DNA_ID=CAMNT_0006904669 /DNA_START=87 /DNA_END=1583 /DNA_ORIENTATION=-